MPIPASLWASGVCLPDGRWAPVLDVYNDEHGQEGGVQATLVVDVG
jgi:hypothetical protein